MIHLITIKLIFSKNFLKFFDIYSSKIIQNLQNIIRIC